MLVFAFFIVSACNSCQRSIGTIEAVKVENPICIQGQSLDCSNVIIVDANFPIEKCGKLNEAGKVFVKEINAFSSIAIDSTFIDESGILQCKGDVVVYQFNKSNL